MKKIMAVVITAAMVATGSICATAAVDKNVKEGMIHLYDNVGNKAAITITAEKIPSQYLNVDKPFDVIEICCPSFADNIGNLTLKLYKWAGSHEETLKGQPIASKTHVDYRDNAWIDLSAGEGKAFPAGEYLFVVDDPVQYVGCYQAPFDSIETFIKQKTYLNGQPMDYCLETTIRYAKEGSEAVEGDTGSTAAPVDNSNVIMYVDAPKAFVKGEEKALDVPPVVVNGRTLLPARFVAESIGAKVDWYEETQTVAIEKGDLLVTLVIGSNEMRVNGEVTILDVPAQTINDRTVVPLRAICEALGQQVNYFPDGDKGLIVVGENAESFDKNVADAFIKLYK